MKALLLTLLVAILSGCATPPSAPAPRLDHTYTAKSQSDRIKYIVIHFTVLDLPKSITTLTEQVVSSHYLLTDTPTPFFYTLVDESRQANHAGVSSWKSYTQLNGSSIGIEIVNPGATETPQGPVFAPFAQAQIDQLILLLKDIVARHHIAPDNILGHNEIAPQRRDDPGPLFPWKQLADAGLISWPDAAQVVLRQPQYDAQLPDVAWFQKKLAQHGYAVPQTGVLDKETVRVLSTFQMKFRPANYAGAPDAESAAILDVLTTPATSSPPVTLPATVGRQ